MGATHFENLQDPILMEISYTVKPRFTGLRFPKNQALCVHQHEFYPDLPGLQFTGPGPLTDYPREAW